MDRVAHRAAGWKEGGVRVEGLMARGVGADQEQEWTEEPRWKETAGRRSGRGYYKRGRALFFIHETRSVVGCSGVVSRVRATVRTDEIISDTDVIIVRWSGWKRGKGGCIRSTTDRWGWGWDRRGRRLECRRGWRLDWWAGYWWKTYMTTCAG